MPETFSLQVSRVIPGPVDEVFDAWLDPELLRLWMNPVPGGSAEAVVDPVVGGKFRILMKMNDAEVPHTGEYQLIERPAKLVFTWNSPYSKDTLVTVQFAKLGIRSTNVTITHERFPEKKVMESHREGWSGILAALDKVKGGAAASSEVVLIPFEVHPDSIDPALQAIKDFLERVKVEEPGTLRYESLQVDGEPTRFYHYMVFRDQQARRYHQETPHVKAFVEKLSPLCSRQPEAIRLSQFIEVNHAPA